MGTNLERTIRVDVISFSSNVINLEYHGLSLGLEQKHSVGQLPYVQPTCRSD